MRLVLVAALAGAAIGTGAQTLPSPLPAASGLRLTVELEPREPAVGDRVSARLVLAGLPDDRVAPRFPEWQGEWGDAEILEVHSPARGGDGWGQQLVLAFFAPGSRSLPAVSVHVADGRETRTISLDGPLSVTVRSVLPAGDGAEPEPAAPPRSIPLGRAFFAVAAALAACCLALTWVAAGRRRETASPRTARHVPPLEELLAHLSAADPQADPARAWERATLALRRFLGTTLGFAATESTTLETRRFLARALPVGLSRRVVGLLRAADRIKFARGTAETAGTVEAIAEIGALARAIDHHVRPGEEAA